MIAFLANGVFYNQLYIHWFWTLIALALAFTRTVAPIPRPARASLAGGFRGAPTRAQTAT